MRRYQNATNRIRRIQDLWLFPSICLQQWFPKSAPRTTSGPRVSSIGPPITTQINVLCFAEHEIFYVVRASKIFGTTGQHYIGILLKLGTQRVKNFYEPLANTWMLSQFKLKTKTFKRFSTQNKIKICSHGITVRKYPNHSLFLIRNKTVCHEQQIRN